MKNIYFISGLPRSGNTLLSSILNENPEIYATGKSSNVEVFYRLYEMYNSEYYKEYPEDTGLDNILFSYFETFYKNIKEKTVIERGDWITPYNLQNLSTYVPNKLKIIIMTRNIPDIIRSFIAVSNRNPNYYLNTEYENFKNNLNYKSELDFKVDLIMNNNHLKNMISSIQILKNNKDFLFVDYDDFVDNPYDILEKIYKYLDLPIFIHDLTDIKQLEGYQDYLFFNDTHTIEQRYIRKRNLDIELPQYIIDKYSKYNL